MSARLEPPAPVGSSAVHDLDARVKVLASLTITVTAVATPIAWWPGWIACLAVLAAIAATAHLGPRVVWQRARIVLPPVLLVAAFLPFVRENGLETFTAVAAKATIGTLSAVVLGATTSFPAILEALAKLRVPKLFVLTAQVTWRYLFVIAGEVQRTRTALTARGYRPRHALQAKTLGQAAGTLFLRAHARGERVHLAMLARGYER